MTQGEREREGEKKQKREKTLFGMRRADVSANPHACSLAFFVLYSQSRCNVEHYDALSAMILYVH